MKKIAQKHAAIIMIIHEFHQHFLNHASAFVGAIDIAGSSAVHVVGGISGLVATIFLKPRTGIFKKHSNGENSNQMASPTNVLLGTFMLWWGWLGFNCGSTFGISGEKWKLAARYVRRT